MAQAKKISERYSYCAMPLAIYACNPEQTRGRIYEEENEMESRKVRSPFQKDRDRITHSKAYRRLQGKTQVFISGSGNDHYRNRLTHTMEVTQITRTIARALMVNEDLAETIALAHDLGHPPFGHAGEDKLKLCMEPYGGFEHNDQSLRIVTRLEREYPGWPGLNLTWETLEGIVKHNGPVKGALPSTLKEVQTQSDLEVGTHASLEAQVAALADDIAYNSHDVEDGLRSGLLALPDLESVPILYRMLRDIKRKRPDISSYYLHRELRRDMIGALVKDVLEETRRRLDELQPESPEDIRRAGRQIVAFSEPMFDDLKELRSFLFQKLYKHSTILRNLNKAENMVQEMFDIFMREYRLLPEHWQERVDDAGGILDDVCRARIVADYIAGMTDRYAYQQYADLFDLSMLAQPGNEF